MGVGVERGWGCRAGGGGCPPLVLQDSRWLKGHGFSASSSSLRRRKERGRKKERKKKKKKKKKGEKKRARGSFIDLSASTVESQTVPHTYFISPANAQLHQRENSLSSKLRSLGKFGTYVMAVVGFVVVVVFCITRLGPRRQVIRANVHIKELWW